MIDIILNIPVWAILVIPLTLSLMKVFEDAGEPKLAALIPIVELYYIVKITKNPWWLFLLAFVPVINLGVYIWLMIDLAQLYQRNKYFCYGLVFLPFIFLPMLAFGKNPYCGLRSHKPLFEWSFFRRFFISDNKGRGQINF